MTVHITIIGLGQIGGSMGLALAGKSQLVTRTGHDKSLETARKAEKAGAVDKVAINLISAVREADLVILALPINQVRDTISLIAQDLKAGAVIVDTCPVKSVVADWVKEYLPQGRYYVGVTPVINPQYLHNLENGFEGAHADLFHHGLLAIVAPAGTASDAIKLVADLTGLLGAEPFFADLMEIDGLMATTHLLPQLLAASLIEATINQPGWQEARKVAGRNYASVTGPIQAVRELKSLAGEAIYARQNATRLLDNLIQVLLELREEIEQQDFDALENSLTHSLEGRAAWWQQRQSASWATEGVRMDEVQTSRDMLGRLIGIRRKKNK